jgi:hypothetical protein
MPKIHAQLEENICFKMVTALKRQCCFGSVFKYQFISVRVIEDQYNIECLHKNNTPPNDCCACHDQNAVANENTNFCGDHYMALHPYYYDANINLIGINMSTIIISV